MRGVSRSQNGTRPLCEPPPPPPAPRMDSRQMVRVAMTWRTSWRPSSGSKAHHKSLKVGRTCAREKLYEQLRTAILTCASHSQLTKPHNLPQRHPTVFCMLISPRSLAPSQLLLLLLLLLCSALLLLLMLLNCTTHHHHL
jgi:hypothetical protein